MGEIFNTHWKVDGLQPWLPPEGLPLFDSTEPHKGQQTVERVLKASAETLVVLE